MNIHECGGALWDAFLRDLVEHPDDLTPRLILADWLEEQAHPIQQARAEIILLLHAQVKELVKTVVDLEAALRRIQAACGLPDPAEACRVVLRISSEVLQHPHQGPFPVAAGGVVRVG